MIHSNVVSLWRMLELKASPFIRAAMQIERIKSVAESGANDSQMDALISVAESPQPIVHLDQLISFTVPLNANLTRIASQRLKDQILTGQMTWNDLARSINEVGDRLKDELDGAVLFVADPRFSHLLETARDPFPEGISEAFPSAVFEMSEAGKCLALHRATAAAFHSIRALEVGLLALARFLSVPDPTKGTDRNWALILKKIKEAQDTRYAAKDRMPGMVGAKVEAAYATFDAVKGPWRNPTMHVERVYQLDEAEHILNSVRVVFENVAAICDENGQPSTV
jgi:hypothetical protein